MKIADRMGGVILLAFAGYVMITSLSMEYVTRGVPGPGFLPFWASVIMAGAAVMILVNSWKKPLKGRLMGNRTILLRTVIFFLAMMAVVLLILYLGMILTLALFMLFIVPFLGARDWPKILISAVLVPLFVYVLFQFVLQIPLPVGPWRF